MTEEREKPDVLMRILEYALSVDRMKQQKYLTAFCRRYSGNKPGQLADRLIRRAQWWGAGYGFVTGVPANPWVAIPAAVTDVGIVLRTEVSLAVRIALLYDPHFLDDDEPPYELLIPILGVRAGSEFLREAATRGAMGLTRVAIRKHLSKQTLAVFRKVMLKYFGLKATQRSVVKGTLPVVGGLVGGGWNYKEVALVGARVKRYFEGDELKEESPE